MESLGKETVIIVHGTWANPKPDRLSWYQIPDEQHEPNFVSKLNSALENRRSPARCWAHCKDNADIFIWSGNNAWIDRSRASSELAAHLNELQANGWRCHLVAHSHGGNVVAEALAQLNRLPERPTGLNGTITTLGTPFVDAMSPIARMLTRRSKFLKVLSWAAYLLFAMIFISTAAFTVFMLSSSEDFGIDLAALASVWRSVAWLVYSPIVISLVVLPIYFLRRRPPTPGWNEYWDGLAKQGSFCPFILSISSRMDEAWQLLYHLRDIPNPLQPKSGLIAYLWESHRAYSRRSAEVARIRGVSSFSEQPTSVKISVTAIWFFGLFLLFRELFSIAEDLSEARTGLAWDLTFGITMILALMFSFATSLTFLFGTPFYLAMLSPVRWVARQVRASSRIFNNIGTYVVRRRSWSLMQELAFGLEGYSFDLPKAERVLTFACPEIYRYEDLPENVEQRALSKREEWLKRNFGAVTETFSRMVVTASDLSSLLRTVETDLSLVHAAYYTDDECIERIANWIAGKA